MSTYSSKWGAWHYWLLWVVVIISLTLNAVLLIGLIRFRLRAQQEIANVAKILDTVEFENFEIPVVVDETLPISLDVDFSETFQVPINETISVSTTVPIVEDLSFPINEVVSIDSDVQVSVEILGQRIPVDVPIQADVPISMNVVVPLDMDVPIETDIPIEMMIEVPVESQIPINTEVPVQMEFPVTVPLDELGFNTLLQEVKDGLQILSELLGANGS